MKRKEHRIRKQAQGTSRAPLQIEKAVHTTRKCSSFEVRLQHFSRALEVSHVVCHTIVRVFFFRSRSLVLPLTTAVKNRPLHLFSSFWQQFVVTKMFHLSGITAYRCLPLCQLVQRETRSVTRRTSLTASSPARLRAHHFVHDGTAGLNRGVSAVQDNFPPCEEIFSSVRLLARRGLSVSGCQVDPKALSPQLPSHLGAFVVSLAVPFVR